MQTVLHFINGQAVASHNTKTFDKRSPLDNRLLYRVAEGGRAEINDAVAAARHALHGEWGKLSTDQRVAMLYAVADGITKRFDDFVAAEEADTGQPHQIGRAHV